MEIISDFYFVNFDYNLPLYKAIQYSAWDINLDNGILFTNIEKYTSLPEYKVETITLSRS